MRPAIALPTLQNVNIIQQVRKLLVMHIIAYQQNDGTVFIKHVLTHADYDKEQWKRDCES